jgi:hypothetical protein
LLAAGQARAQSGENQAAAQALYDEARKLVDAKSFAEACPKFKESYDLDPAGGTLLNLADCYEKLGKPALAWTTFKDALVAAQRDGNGSRIEFAKTHIAALEKSLAYVTIQVPDKARVDGLSVTLDGTPIGSATWGVALPVDPGSHTVRAEAPGHQPFERSIDTASGGQREEVSVPPLAAAPGGAGTTPPAGGESTSTQSFWNGRNIGWISMGVGVVGVAVGSYFGVKAFSDWDDRNQGCKSGCTPAAKDAGSQASTAATISTVGFAVGGIALATGVVLVVTSHGGSKSAGSTPSFQAGVVPAPGGALLNVRQAW